MIEEIQKNIDTEIEILREIANYSRMIDYSEPADGRLIAITIESLKSSMRLINNAIPKVLGSFQTFPELPTVAAANAKKDEKKNELSRSAELENVKYQRDKTTLSVILNAKDREKFLRDLSISESTIKKIKKKGLINEVIPEQDFKRSRGYLKLSNKVFLDRAIEFISKGYFRTLSIEIKKSNLDILFETYVAMIFFTTLLSFFVGLLIMVFVLFVNISLYPLPNISFYTGSLLMRLLKVIWLPFVIPVIVYFSLYIYPSTEKSSLSKKIDNELPFAIIHMSSISGSGIEPAALFRIIGLSKEYPALGKEIRKVLNQINLYGYDLITALINASKSSPNQKLSELFSGVAATVGSGANLPEFFEKRAETLLLDYRLDREKFTKIAESFMDIYISIVIAAPMILMLLLIMMFVSGFGGMPPGEITFLIVAVISLINIVFLAFLQLKQPAY